MSLFIIKVLIFSRGLGGSTTEHKNTYTHIHSHTLPHTHIQAILINLHSNICLEICLLTDNIYDYHIVSQGKVTVPSIDDSEEFILTDVIVQKVFTLFVLFLLYFLLTTRLYVFL